MIDYALEQIFLESKKDKSDDDSAADLDQENNQGKNNTYSAQITTQGTTAAATDNGDDLDYKDDESSIVSEGEIPETCMFPSYITLVSKIMQPKTAQNAIKTPFTRLIKGGIKFHNCVKLII